MKNKPKKQEIVIIFFSILTIIYGILCVLADMSIINFDIEKYIPSTYAIIFIGLFSVNAALLTLKDNQKTGVQNSSVRNVATDSKK